MSAASEIDFAKLIEPVARHLLGTPNARLSTKDELRFGTNGSISVEIGGNAAGTWYDNEHKIGGGTLDLIAAREGLRDGKAIDWLRNGGFILNEKAERRRKIECVYDYKTFQVVRFTPRTFASAAPMATAGGSGT